VYYLVQPFEGSGMAFLLYAVIRGGLLSGAGERPANQFSMCAVAGLAGTFSDMAYLKLREVFQVLFKPELKPKLASYLAREFSLSKDQAASVVDAVNLLPASKRRAEDTYLVLAQDGVSNLTNTEFPDHQLKVLQRSREKGFNLADFENSISSGPDPEVLRRLLEISDFRKAYGLTTQLVGDLGKIGVEAPKEASGLEPEEWSSYGPTRKTMEEFTNAYLSFRTKLVSSLTKPS